MPELPEIEHLKRSLEPALIGAAVRNVRLHRPDIATFNTPHPHHRRLLGLDRHITKLRRLGKQLAIHTESGPTICLHMGMSGQLRFIPKGQKPPKTDHIHCTWTIDGPRGPGRLIFRDPRRFGGLWAYDSPDDLQTHRWSSLGPDALSIKTAQLRVHFGRTRRPVKAALLDQRVIAGVGNIYADESLFYAGIHPAARTDTLTPSEVTRLARGVRTILTRAIDAGGSTLRDYVDAHGNAGTFTNGHHVYGRAGHPCVRCQSTLIHTTLAQRTTVFCPTCQQITSTRS